MSKWEDKYEKYKNGGIDQIIEDLKKNGLESESINKKELKVGSKDVTTDMSSKGIVTKKEKEEYKKLTKIKDKMPQIENVVEYRNRLKNDLKQMKEEMGIRENLEKATKEKEDLEKKIAGYQDRYEKISKELKNNKLEADKRKKLESEKSEIAEKMPKAQEKMEAQEDILLKSLGEKRELAKLSKEEIDKKMFETQNKISKCNLVAGNLLNGLNWEQIDIKLDNWKDRKLTSKDGKLDKDIEDFKIRRQEKVDKFALDRDKMADIIQMSEENYYDKDLIEYNKPELTFADRHPRLAKIGNFFKNMKDKFFNREEKGSKDVKEKGSKDVKEKELGDIKEKNDEEPKNNEKGKSFKDEIKIIAQVGYKEAKNKELRTRYEAMREENRKLEEEKFGKEYADMSRTTDDGSR